MNARHRHRRWWWTAAIALLASGPRPAARAQANELSMEAAVELARAHAPELERAQAELEASRARVDAARSPLLPQVSGTLGYDRATFNGGAAAAASGGARSRSSLQTRNQWSAALRGSQLVYDFGQSRAGLAAAQASARADAHSALASWIDAEYSVRAAYLSAAAARALIRVAQDNLDNQVRHLEQIQAFVEVGTRPAIDLAQARTDVANARLSLVRAENDYAMAKTRLERAMGHKPDAAYEVSPAVPAPEPDEGASLEALLSRAERDRPEFEALREQMRAQSYNIDAREAGYAPSLSVQADVSESGTQLDELAFNFGAGVTLSWPIFQGGLVGARIREARAVLAGLESQRDALLADLRMALEQTLLSLRAAQSASEIAREVAVNAAERLTLAEGRYSAGVGNIIELGDAQLVLSTAQAQAVSADYEVALARAQLRQALGRSTAPPK